MRQISLWVRAASPTKWGSTVNMALCEGFTTILGEISRPFAVSLEDKIQYSLLLLTSLCPSSTPVYSRHLSGSCSLSCLTPLAEVQVWKVLPLFLPQPSLHLSPEASPPVLPCPLRLFCSLSPLHSSNQLSLRHTLSQYHHSCKCW